MVRVIAFNKTREEGGWCSNMAPFSVEYKGRHCRTTEHLFQALRLSPDLVGEDADTILEIPSPLQAKWAAKAAIAAGRAVVEPWSPEDIENMRLCVRLKHEQHERIQTLLAATGDKYIVEDTTTRQRPDRFWGATRSSNGVVSQRGTVIYPGDGSVWEGRNWLGRIWMDLRGSGRLL